MAFLARALRFLFWVVLLTWGLSLLRRFLRQLARPPVRDSDVGTDAAGQKLVRDPVCGMHIAPALALTAQNGPDTLYFCTPECRDKFFRDTKKFAANA